MKRLKLTVGPITRSVKHKLWYNAPWSSVKVWTHPTSHPHSEQENPHYSLKPKVQLREASFSWPTTTCPFVLHKISDPGWMRNPVLRHCVILSYKGITSSHPMNRYIHDPLSVYFGHSKSCRWHNAFPIWLIWFQGNSIIQRLMNNRKTKNIIERVLRCEIDELINWFSLQVLMFVAKVFISRFLEQFLLYYIIMHCTCRRKYFAQ